MEQNFINTPGGQIIAGTLMGAVISPVVIVASEAVEAAEFEPEYDDYTCECIRQARARQKSRAVRLMLSDR